MEWQIILLIFFGSFLLLMVLGLPVAFAFLGVNVIVMYFFWGGASGLQQLAESLFTSIASFTLLPIPLFILMGEVMFRSGQAPQMLEALDMWLGRLPGRLSLLSVAGGTVFATLTGASMASVAMLGSSLVPEMSKRGYKYEMSLGPILGSGGLAIMIPPSNLAVLLGAVGEISVGRILIAIIMPGLVMAATYAAYIIIRVMMRPDLAPAYAVSSVPLSTRIIAFAKYVVPIFFIVFLVTGLIFVGVATPSEAAATGSLGTFILAAIYKKLTWKMVKESVFNTLNMSLMIFLIIAAAYAFSQIIAFSGAGNGLVGFALTAPVSPTVIIIVMLVVSIFLGMFINLSAIIMLTIPLFVPVVKAMGFDTVWFAAAFMITLEMGAISPPFGLSLFVMKGVAGEGVTMMDCYKAVMPFLYCNLFSLAIIVLFPIVTQWLPSLMR